MRIESLSIGGRYFANEDRLTISDLSENGIIAVLADGMGGLSLGDIAAETVCSSINSYITSNINAADEHELLLKSLENADKEVSRLSIEYKSKMGATVAVAVIRNQILHYTWQGNVRIYIFRNGTLTLLTKDHIADVGYGKNALTRCIKGRGLRDDVPVGIVELQAHDVIILCSDGFYNTLDLDSYINHSEQWENLLGNPEDDASVIRLSLD